MDNLSIIILNYNSYQDTLLCIERLLSFKDDFHIIVVDNHSSDQSLELIREKYPDLDLLALKDNLGYSYGNNAGMKYAIEKYHSKYLGIINPDVLLDTDSILKKGIKLLEDPSIVVVGGKTLDINDIFNVRYSAWSLPGKLTIGLEHFLLYRPLHTLKLTKEVEEVDCVVGCFFLTKTSFMQSVNFLDDHVFLYNEENLLGFKVKENHLKEVIMMDESYHHNHKRSYKKLTFKEKIHSQENSYASRKYLCKKYYPWYSLVLLWIMELLNKIYLTLCFIIKRR